MEHSLEMTFKQHRMRCGFTYATLAAETEASMSTVEDFEAGRIGPKDSGKRVPTGRTMKRFADAFECSVTDVIEFRNVLGLEERQETSALDMSELYQLYTGDEEFRRFAESRYARRTISGAEVA